MRPFLTLTLALLMLASAAPTALASPSALRIDLPQATLGHDATVPVNVTLVIQDFMCSEPRTFTVLLASNATEGVKAAFASSSLTFTTDAHAYFAEEYRQTQTVNLTVRALQAGEVELTALFAPHERGPCLAPDGFIGSSATVLVAVEGPPASAPSDPAAGEPATNGTPPADPTPATPPTPRPTAAPAAPAGERPMTCAPDGGCGFISDYKPPQESANNDTPGLGLAGALAALAIVAFASRRKK